jgi:hypothetical protein
MRDNAIVVPISALRRIFVMLLVLIAVILGVLVVRTQLFRAGISTLFAPGPTEVIDRNAYQAVFLTNGQTFFGRLQEQGDDWFTMTEIFYVSASDQGPTQIIKRGNELQGPKEPMLISKRQVLFIENLRDDSDIVTAIRKFRSGQLPAATQPPVTPAPTTAAPSTARPSPSPTR